MVRRRVGHEFYASQVSYFMSLAVAEAVQRLELEKKASASNARVRII